ncbi:MAG: hypothetical protein RLZZ453_785 [Chlamydiota bacterium]|jgi:purine-cytosine permease-like protein
MKNNKYLSNNQSVASLATIPAAAIGIPHLFTGPHLANAYGAGTAICSLLVGNLVLWLIAISVIAMMEQQNINAITNIKKYLGFVGSILSAIIFLVGFINWYAFELDLSINLITAPHSLRLGAGLGLFCALLSIGGLSLLKTLSKIALPFFIAIQVYLTFTSSQHIKLTETWSLSFPAVIQSVLPLFPIVMMLPTLFRYAKSSQHAYLAATLFILLSAFFGVSSIWCNYDYFKETIFLGVFFILLKTTCCNLFNIYLASACWETIIPKSNAAKEHTIIGLCGTLLYTFIQITHPTRIISHAIDGYLASLGGILLIAYLSRALIRHRPKPFEKAISITSWLVGCAIASYHPSAPSIAMLTGIIFFLCILFIEENVWAIRNKLLRETSRIKSL